MVKRSARIFEQWKPAVDRRVLPVIAGLVWVLVGVMLAGRAVAWLHSYNGGYLYLFLLGGIVLFLIKYNLVFRKLVNRNLERIRAMHGKPCLFSFVSWKSYLLILIMASLGIFLRNSTIPPEYLSVVYLGVGFAMVMSGMRYFVSTAWRGC